MKLGGFPSTLKDKEISERKNFLSPTIRKKFMKRKMLGFLDTAFAIIVADNRVLVRRIRGQRGEIMGTRKIKNQSEWIGFYAAEKNNLGFLF
jgi:hypothetical protein